MWWIMNDDLCPFNESLTDVEDAEDNLAQGGDVIVDDTCQVQGHVVFDLADLLQNFNDLNLDINLDELFAERVDL